MTTTNDTPERSGRSGADRWIPAALLLLFGLYFALPISDIDFWWHVASGRWIVEHGALPATDPFGVFRGDNPVRAATVLRGQWLGQVVAFRVLDAFGEAGIVALRVALLCVTVAIAWARARAGGASAAWSTSLAALVGLTLLTLAGDRPQLFSFALAGLLFAAVDALDRRWSRWLAALVPLLVALWANLHGGAILGAILAAAHAAGGAATALREGRRADAGRRILVALAALLATLATPNGLTSYAYVLQTQASVLAARTTEYVGTLRIGSVAGWGVQALAGLCLALALPCGPALARRGLGRLLVVLVAGAASLTSYRYHLFFVIVCAPWLAVALGDLAGRGSARAAGIGARVAVACAALPIVALLAWRTPLAARRGTVAEGAFPVEAARYLRDRGLEGRILGWFNWSGYLLWTTFPRVRPFLDPRMLDDAALGPYTHMLWATPEGIQAFDEGRFELVLLPYRSAAGEPYPIHVLLGLRGDYRPVFRWPEGALYARVGAGG